MHLGFFYLIILTEGGFMGQLFGGSPFVDSILGHLIVFIAQLLSVAFASFPLLAIPPQVLVLVQHGVEILPSHIAFGVGDDVFGELLHEPCSLVFDPLLLFCDHIPL